MSAAPSDTALQGILILAKNSKGKAASAVVMQAIGTPGLFHFGELLVHPNIAPLAETDKPTYELLKIFAYGVLADYKAASGLPELNAQQLTKLRQLTLCTLANEKKIIPYSVLLSALDMSNLRELEDLIIDCIYAGLIRGKLDQKQQHLQVDFVVSRDIRTNQIDSMLRILAAWSEQAEQLMRVIEQQIAHAQGAHEAYRQQKKDFEEKFEALKKTVAAQQEAEGGHPGFDFEDEKGRKGMKGRGRKGMMGSKRGPGFFDWMN